jgi:RNA polymerase sigma factor (TIGR02999 family)
MSEETPHAPVASDKQDDREGNEQLFAALYGELRRLADRELHRHPALSVSPTTLVHEAYVNLAGREGLAFAERGKFLGYAARAMRGLLIDFARRQQASKRGGGFHITQLDAQVGEDVADSAKLGRLSDALDELATVNPRLAELVDLKYFCGFSFSEIAALQGTSERTAQRDWERARLILFDQLSESPP